jgi:hypothetical protein
VSSAAHRRSPFLGLKSSEWVFSFQREGSIDGEEQRSVGNCSQPSRAKYSAEVFKEVNDRNSPWRTREVMRVVDRDQFKRGIIS